MVKEHLGTIPEKKLRADFKTIEETKRTLFDFLTRSFVVENQILFRNKTKNIDSLRSKEIYDKAHTILTKKRKVFELIKLVIEFYFTDPTDKRFLKIKNPDKRFLKIEQTTT